MEIKKKLKKTILVVEHNFDFLLKFADKIMVIKNGTNSDFYETTFAKNNLDKLLFSE